MRQAAELAALCEEPDAHTAPSPTGPDRAAADRDRAGRAPGRAIEGCNDFGEEGYGGPLHRSVTNPTDTSSVFATSAPLELTAAASAEDLRRALERKQLAGDTLVGTYQR